MNHFLVLSVQMAVVLRETGGGFHSSSITAHHTHVHTQTPHTHICTHMHRHSHTRTSASSLLLILTREYDLETAAEAIKIVRVLVFCGTRQRKLWKCSSVKETCIPIAPIGLEMCTHGIKKSQFCGQSLTHSEPLA